MQGNSLELFEGAGVRNLLRTDQLNMLRLIESIGYGWDPELHQDTREGLEMINPVNHVRPGCCSELRSRREAFRCVVESSVSSGHGLRKICTFGFVKMGTLNLS